MKDWRPKLTAINDPIADDYWSYRTEDGAKRTSRVTIGRPALLADGTNWYCPMYFEHVTRGIDYAMGVGPVDALMNAMYFVRRLFYEFDDARRSGCADTWKRRERLPASDYDTPRSTG